MKLLLLLPLLLLSFTSTAENADEPVILEIPQGWAVNINFGSASINSDLSSQGLGDSATAFGLSFDKLDGNRYWSIFAERVTFDDDYGFRQDVITTSYGSSSRSTEKSEASALSIGSAYGLAWFVNNNKAMFYAQGGLNLLLDASRSIPSCDDCHEEDLDVEGGLFAKVGGNIYINDFILGAYTSFAFSGDVESSIGITAGFKY